MSAEQQKCNDMSIAATHRRTCLRTRLGIFYTLKSFGTCSADGHDDRRAESVHKEGWFRRIRYKRRRCRIDTCLDMYLDMHLDMRIDMFGDNMHGHVCRQVCRQVCRHVYRHVSRHVCRHV